MSTETVATTPAENVVTLAPVASPEGTPAKKPARKQAPRKASTVKRAPAKVGAKKTSKREGGKKAQTQVAKDLFAFAQKRAKERKVLLAEVHREFYTAGAKKFGYKPAEK